MNSSAKNEHVRKLVEQYGPREIYRFFAAKILLPETTQELRPPSKVPAEPRKIILNKQILREMRKRTPRVDHTALPGRSPLLAQTMAKKMGQKPKTLEGKRDSNTIEVAQFRSRV